MVSKKLNRYIQYLRLLRNTFFEDLGKTRWKRIMMCVFVVMMIWIAVDLKSGNYEVNFRDDLICLVVGIVAERLIPWGKTSTNRNVKLKEQNLRLLSALKQSNELLMKLNVNSKQQETPLTNNTQK